ncbi:TPA: fimbrial protein [Escherichia coli]|nr:fimbrial protein [Escherichia coli]HEA8699758.1 fimbrial protein [Escherichia coli]
MKKTLIALALTASAVSGIAHAWTNGDFNGSVDLGGTITPDIVTGPWEVKAGSNLTGLDATVASGATSVNITLPSDSLVLGIRSTGWFTGQAGISPQISYAGSIGNTFENGKVDLTLNVKDSSTDQEIGVLTTKLTTAGVVSRVRPAGEETHNMYAANAGEGFFGGLSLSHDSSTLHNAPVDLANKLDSTILDNWEQKGDSFGSNIPATFDNVNAQFNSFYVSGLETSDNVSIQLNEALTTDVEWKASLPITVSYQ